MAISNEKIRIAWELLRRRPDYIKFYDELRVLESKWSKKIGSHKGRKRIKSTIDLFGIISARTDIEIENERRLQRIDLLHKFGLTKAVDYNVSEPEGLFSAKSGIHSDIFAESIFHFVTPFYEVPNDQTFLHLKINPFGSREAIQSKVLKILSQHNKVKNIYPPGKFPARKELRLYLLILDNYNKFIKSGEETLTPSKKSDNFGLVLRWAEFERFLYGKGFDMNANDLRQSKFRTALTLRNHAPLSVLF